MQYDQPDAVARLAGIIQTLKDWLKDRSVLELACGPGFWTMHLVPVAKTILATDANRSALDEVRKKSFPLEKVKLQIADAYSLQNITESFDGAFAGDWWSHIPKERIASFLGILASKLNGEARIAFTDQLPNEKSYREGSYHDVQGNHIQRRHLSDGSRFEVVKNFPTQDDLRSAVASYATQIQYQTFPECRRWLLTFTLKKK
jgi:cyclopropane fatty-acyl-phospholipid synthase-like methyltransferase